MATDLVTLAEYKAYQSISSNTQDSTISALIPTVSELIKTICRSRLVDYVDDAKIEVFPGGLELVLMEAPLIGISSIELSSDFGSTYTLLTEFTDWAFDSYSQTIKSTTSPTFASLINGYRVTYNAGYDPLPLDLKLAVMDTITYYLKNNTAIHSPKAPGSNTIQIEYVTKARLPAQIQRVLDMYTVHYM